MTDSQLGIIIGALTVLQALGIFILKSVLQNTLKFEFKKREQAAMVASLSAEWMDASKYSKDLNRLTWEANLWLPDNIACEVNKRLSNSPGAQDVREILVAVKGLIHGRKSTLNPADIVYYPKQ
jgi:hypothetical protein